MAANSISDNRPDPPKNQAGDRVEADEYIQRHRYGTAEEALEELQAGEVVGNMGFVPHRFLNDYLFRKTDAEGQDRTANIDEIAQNIIDRLVVVSPTNNSGASLQMKLVHDAFDGSEIWFQREKGELKIEFKASSNESFDFLSSKHEELSNKISDSLKIDVTVKIVRKDSESSADE